MPFWDGKPVHVVGTTHVPLSTTARTAAQDPYANLYKMGGRNDDDAIASFRTEQAIGFSANNQHFSAGALFNMPEDKKVLFHVTMSAWEGSKEYGIYPYVGEVASGFTYAASGVAVIYVSPLPIKRYGTSIECETLITRGARTGATTNFLFFGYAVVHEGATRPASSVRIRMSVDRLDRHFHVEDPRVQ